MLDHAVQRTIEKSNKNCYSLVYRVHNYIKRLIWYLYIFHISCPAGKHNPTSDTAEWY